jgi:hypothetical protein
MACGGIHINIILIILGVKYTLVHISLTLQLKLSIITEEYYGTEDINEICILTIQNTQYKC